MSEKLLPIVAGCRAILISCKDPLLMKALLTEVTVIRMTNNTPSGRSLWEISSQLIRSIHDYGVFAPEHYLMRIDGGEFEHEKEEQEMKL